MCYKVTRERHQINLAFQSKEGLKGQVKNVKSSLITLPR